MAYRSKNAGPRNAKYIPRGPLGEKVCSQCRQAKVLTSFVIDKSRFDGRGYRCEECRTAKRTKRGPTIPERRRKRIEGFAWCCGCNTWLAIGKVRAALCQPCANRKMRDRYANDPTFKQSRKGRSIARRRGIDPIPLDAREAIFEEFEGRCAYCPAPATTWDHVVAFKKGGLTEPYNIVPACSRCNSSKRTQNVWVWLEKTGRIAHERFYERLSLYNVSLFPARGPDPFD